MNKTRNYFLLLAFVAVAVSLVSCLDDGEDNTKVTAQQRLECLKMMKGDYTGKLIYGVVESNIEGGYIPKTDTIDNQQWTSDTVLITYKKFPVRILATGCADESMKEAVANCADTPDLKVYYGDFINGQIPYVFFLKPEPISINVTYGGVPHKLTFKFNEYYCNGTYTTSFMTSQMVVSLFLDGSETPSTVFKEMALFYTNVI